MRRVFLVPSMAEYVGQRPLGSNTIISTAAFIVISVVSVAIFSLLYAVSLPVVWLRLRVQGSDAGTLADQA